MAQATNNLAPPQAAWIGSDHPFDLHEAYLCFRGACELAHAPAQARLWVTADSRYRLWVNGQAVARGPARCYPHAQAVDCLDVTGWLRPGPNVIAAQVYSPGYSHFAYVHRAAAGLLAWLLCDGELALATDAGWRVRRDRSFAAQAPRVSIYGSGVEERDLALDEPWQAPAYDGAGWAAARVVSPAAGGLWAGLQPRALPLLAERDAPTALLVARVGAYPAELAGDVHMALRAGWAAAAPAELERDEQGWVDVNLTPGQAAYWLVDLGRGHAAQGWAEVAGARGGELLSVSYLDKLADDNHHRDTEDTERPEHKNLSPLSASVVNNRAQKSASSSNEGSHRRDTERPEHKNLSALSASVVNNGVEPVISDPATYCRVRLTDRFRLRAGDQLAEPFALRGGRFLLFQLASPNGGALRLRLHARVSEYPLRVDRPLAARDPLLAQVIGMCESTFRACLADGFVDCSWRESSQWVGDALPQALIMGALSDDTRPLRRVIELAAQGAYPDGVLPGVVPGEVHAYTVVDYNFIWVELLALYHRLTGDRAFVAAMWPTLARMLDRFAQDAQGDGLLRSQPGRRLFLDWAPLARGEPSAVYNLHYLLALRTALALAEEMVDHQDTKALRENVIQSESSSLRAFVVNFPVAEQATTWRERAEGLAEAARAAFWDGERWHDDPARTTHSQLAAALALLAGAATPAEAPALLDMIAARSLDPRDEPLPGAPVLASPFMHHYLLEALRAGGRGDDVLAIIRLRWGRWAAAGEPTTWENWNVDFPDGSRCHAFSAHPLYHLAEIARAGAEL